MQISMYAEKIRHYIFILSASLGAAMFYSLIVAAAAKLTFDLTEEKSLLLIALPLGVFIFIFFIYKFTEKRETFIEPLVGKKRIYNKSIPGWLLAVITITIISLALYLL